MTDIQNKLLEIYKQFKDFCSVNNLKFYAIGGTAIGAVRHNGFIPWDDDLDIAMPVEDIIRLIQLQDKLPKNLKFLYPAKAHHYKLPFFKIVDTKSTMIESFNINYKDCYIGAWIDIFPLIGLPIYDEEFKNYKKKLKKFSFINRYIRTPLKEFKFSRYPIWLLINLSKPFLTDQTLWKKYLKLISNIPFYKSDITCYVTNENNLEKTKFPSKYFGTPKESVFEDTSIYLPDKNHEILTFYFGNYMELPPIEQRNSGHDFKNGIIDLKIPYENYK